MADDLAAWFARKLGVGQQQAQPPQQYPVQQYQPPQQYQQQVWSPQPQPPQLTDEQLVAMKRAGQITFSDGVALTMRRWAGDRKRGAARHETENCPECDSPNYFTRHALRKRGMSNAAPAPMCMNCGYNGIYEGLIAPEVSGDEPVWVD